MDLINPSYNKSNNNPIIIDNNSISSNSFSYIFPFVSSNNIDETNGRSNSSSSSSSSDVVKTSGDIDENDINSINDAASSADHHFDATAAADDDGKGDVRSLTAVIKSDGVTAAVANTNEGTEATTTTAEIISVEHSSIDHRLIGLKDSIQAVLNEGVGFGIETSIHRVLYLLLTLVEWVLETMSLLCDSCIVRYKTIAPANYVSRIQQQLLLSNCIDSGHHHHHHHDLFEWKCWEYLSSPVRVDDWTDIDIELVRSLIDQGQLLMQYLSYKDSSNEHDGENENQHDDVDDERESTRKLTLAIVNNADDHAIMKDDDNDDDDDDNDDDDDDINVAVMKNSSGMNNKSKSSSKKSKKKSHTKATNKSTNAPSNTVDPATTVSNLSGSKRKKRDSSIGDSISIITHTAGSDSAAAVVLPKSTRAMSGISKKKATSDSITKAPTDDPSATTPMTTIAAAVDHQSGINSNNTIPSQYLFISHLQGISIDESRLFYVALAYNTLETCSIQAQPYLSDVSSSSAAIDAMGHMWLKVLKSFESLLSDIKAWSHRVDHLLQHYMNHDTVQLPQASSTGGLGTGLQQQASPTAGSVSVSMRVNEAFEKLLLEAEQKKITNKRR